MKRKQLISLMAILLLTACADKNQYEQAVLEHLKHEQQLQKEQHLKDYPIDSERMAKCVVDTSALNMPGLFALDPIRMSAYRSYAKMLTLSKSADPKKTLEELRTEFGSARALTEANANFTESVLECLSSAMGQIEGDVKAREPQ